MENNCYPFVNLPLPYAYDALEPFIDEKTMRLHHEKHLQAYIDNLNAVLKEEPQAQSLSLQQMLQCPALLPARIRIPAQRNAGGVYNHRLYFSGLANPAQGKPEGRLMEEIERRFGGFEAFQKAFQKAALSVFGSGYAWLAYGRCGLQIVTTANQDTPLAQGAFPILTIDVWEHAYYLKHYNVRAGYVSDWRQVLNWKEAEKRFLRRICPS